MSQKLTEKEQKRLDKIVDECVKLSLFERLTMLQKQYPNDTEFGKEVRKTILLLK